MKFVTAKDKNGVFVGIVNEENNSVLPIRKAEERRSGELHFPVTMIECIALGDDFIKK